MFNTTTNNFEVFIENIVMSLFIGEEKQILYRPKKSVFGKERRIIAIALEVKNICLNVRFSNLGISLRPIDITKSPTGSRARRFKGLSVLRLVRKRQETFPWRLCHYS